MFSFVIVFIFANVMKVTRIVRETEGLGMRNVVMKGNNVNGSTAV